MYPQEIEERSYFPQSEAQNCLAEAMPAARERRGEVKVFGNPKDKIQMDILEPVFCRATDAFAGMLHVETHWFSTPADIEGWLNNNYDPEIEIKVTNHRRLGVLARINTAYRGVFGKELPEIWQTPLRTYRTEAMTAMRAAREKGQSIREAFAVAIAASQTEYFRADSEIPF